MATRPSSAFVTLPSDTEILITRAFEAPRSLIWQALTEPRHLLRWWGPTWCPLESCEVDLRVGGTWRYVARTADGLELGWHGEYRQIDIGERIVSTEVFEGFPDAESVNTMTLQEEVVDGVALSVLRTMVRHSSQANRDGHVQSGMESGMQDTFDRLDDILANANSAAERFRRVAGKFTDVASSVAAHQWANQAPCQGWVARDIIVHMVEWVPSVIGRSGVPFPEMPSPHTEPLAAWIALANSLQDMLDDPEVAAISFDAGPPGTLRVETAIDMIVLGDVLIHTWDLATAVGQNVTLEQELVSGMLLGMQPIDDMLRQSGHYGPKVSVAEEADDQTKLIAFTGRDPFVH